jgi:GTPase SAR1 family protein
MLDEVKRKFNAVKELAEETGVEEIINLSKFLNDRINHPDNFAAMLGETSSGKTTLLNGLLGGNYLYTSVKPSTGAIIELEFAPEKIDHQYYAILQNAKAAELSREDFIENSKKPDDRIKRLWMKTMSSEYGDCKMRLFDTPGYGSVIEKHEEVLTEFLPESNIIVYVVLHKVGIQQDDFNFINYASEIIAKDTEFILVVNRVPEQAGDSDRRVDEIKNYVSDLLHYTPKTFLVSDIICENNEYPLPVCNELWSYLKGKILSEENQKQLEESFEAYVFGLYDRCNDYITQKELARKFNRVEKDLLVKELENQIARIEAAKDKLVRPEFEKLISAMPSKLARAKMNVTSAIHKKIDESSKARQDEVVAYINHHMLQFETKKQVDGIRDYIESKLTRLNKQIDDMLNQCIQQLKNTVDLHFSVEAANMAKGFFKKYAGNFLEQSLLSYFKQFAGRGGTGIANGAKHLLKKLGDLIKISIRRDTYNKLASTLSKIGATSAKAVGIAVGVVLEIGFMVYDALTWQSNLKKKVTKGVEKWHDEVVAAIQDELKKLEAENLKLLDEHIDGFRNFIAETCEDKPDEKKIDKLTALRDTVKAKIGEYSCE